MFTKIITLLAAAAAAQAAAVPDPSRTIGPGPELPTGFVKAVGGALDLPAPNPTAKPDVADAAQAWANVMTITFANHDNNTVRVAHRLGAGSPNPIGNFVRDACIGRGKQEVVHYPGGFHGAAFVNLDAPG